MNTKKSKTEHYLNTKLKDAWNKWGDYVERREESDSNEENLYDFLSELKDQISYLNLKVDYLMHALENKDSSFPEIIE